jgi:hypothetical protein
MVFVGTMYTQAGDLIGKALDAKGQAVIAEHNAQEQISISAVHAVIAAHEKNLTLVQEMQSVFALQAELMATLEQAKHMELKHSVRNDVVAKLDYLAAKEEQFRTTVQSLLVAKATAGVEAKFKTDKKLQDSALEMVRVPPFELQFLDPCAHLMCRQAMATIADPTKAQPDAVAPVYAAFFQKHNVMIAAKVASMEGAELSAEQIEAADAEVLVSPPRLPSSHVAVCLFVFNHAFFLPSVAGLPEALRNRRHQSLQVLHEVLLRCGLRGLECRGGWPASIRLLTCAMPTEACLR